MQPERSGFLCQVLEAVVAAGATTVNIPDTVGLQHTGGLRATAAHSAGASSAGIDKVTISTHCHNDLGLAVANSMAGVQAGARQVECTINGIGERAGNASLEEIVMAMRVRPDRYPYETGIVSEQIYASSQMLEEITRVPCSRTRRSRAQRIRARSWIHQDGMLKNPLTYEIMTPQSVVFRIRDWCLANTRGAMRWPCAVSNWDISLIAVNSMRFIASSWFWRTGSRRFRIAICSN